MLQSIAAPHYTVNRNFCVIPPTPVKLLPGINQTEVTLSQIAGVRLRNQQMGIGLILGILLIMLAACGDSEAPPNPDPPILTGFEAVPKQLATIAMTPTPTSVMAGGSSVAVSVVTPTSGPPRPTATLTPYVGVFLGEPTSESGEAPPTLAPYIANAVPGNTGPIGPVVSSGNVGVPINGTCATPVMTTFANAYPGAQDRLGCPVNDGSTLSIVAQTFERGTMYWRSDTRTIYALASDGQFWQVADSWNDGMPVDDPMLVPPGGLIQPVRGFGLAWRNTQAIRDAIGWATAAEYPYQGMWQDFERGAMFVGTNNQVYAIYAAEGTHSGPLSG